MSSLDHKIQCAGDAWDVSFSTTTTIVVHVSFSSVTQLIAQAFYAWSEFDLRIGTTQLPPLSKFNVELIAFQRNLQSDWGKILRYGYSRSNLALLGRTGVEVIHAMYQAVASVTLHRICVNCFPPLPSDFPHRSMLDVDFQWRESVIKSNTSHFISSRKEQVQNPQLQAKSSLSTASSLWSPLDPYSLQEEFYPADHVYPLDHVAYWSANNFVCWIDDSNDSDGCTNPVHT